MIEKKRPPKVHDLKTWSEFMRSLSTGEKTCELRRDDRNFAVDDILVLREFDPESGVYTGRAVVRRITHILEPGPVGGLEAGFVVLSIVDAGTL